MIKLLDEVKFETRMIGSFCVDDTSVRNGVVRGREPSSSEGKQTSIPLDPFRSFPLASKSGTCCKKTSQRGVGDPRFFCPEHHCRRAGAAKIHHCPPLNPPNPRLMGGDSYRGLAQGQAGQRGVPEKAIPRG